MLASIFLTQMRAHIDLVNGDCEEIQSSCPWTQIGCPETKVCKILDLTSVRRGSRIKLTNVEKKNDTDSFLRELSPHLRSSHYFALPEGYQTYLFVGVYGGGGRGGGKSQWEI